MHSIFYFLTFVVGLISFPCFATEEILENPNKNANTTLFAKSVLQTPLQQDAQIFLREFESLNLNLSGFPSSFDSYIHYIEDVIKADEISRENDFRYKIKPSIPPELKKRLENFENFFLNQENMTMAKEDSILNVPWLNTLKKLAYNDKNINKDSPNAFACYFLGFFYVINPALNHKDEAKFLFDQASQKYYPRAAQFLIDHGQWRLNDCNINEIYKRLNFITFPADAFEAYAKDHTTRESIKSGDKVEFENIFMYLSDNLEDQKKYIEIYEYIAQQVSRALSIRQQKETPRRLVTAAALGALAGSYLLMSTGIDNIVKGHQPNDSQPLWDKAIGYTQIGVAGTSLIAASSGFPFISNLWYRSQWQKPTFKSKWPCIQFKQRPLNFQGHLLTPEYSKAEISTQAHLLTLYGFMVNVDENKKPQIGTKTMKKYAHQLTNLILQSHDQKDEALIKIMTEQEKQKFKFRDRT